MSETTLQTPRQSKIHEAAEEVAREAQELILHTGGSIYEFAEVCRPDVARELDRLGDDRDEVERDRVLDTLREVREAIMRLVEPRFTLVLKQMFIDAANELAAQVPPIAVRRPR